MAAVIGKKTTDLPLFVISHLTSQKKILSYRHLSGQRHLSGWEMFEGLAIRQAMSSGLRNALEHLLTLVFSPSLKVALSLELALLHFIPGCTALSDKMGVDSQSFICSVRE